MKSERQHREDIVRFGKLLHQHGFVAATDGNISVRVDHESVLTTPTGMSKGMLEPEDMVLVDLAGRKMTGRRNASSELAMHLLIYKLRPDVNAVVHAHPPTATGYAAAGLPLNQALVSEVVLALGCVPLAQYGTPGTPELTEALAPLVPKHDALLMANHGVVSYGDSLMRAYMHMETVEQFAKIALVTQLLGRQQLLNEEQVGKLVEARARYGLNSPGVVAGCPVTSPGQAAPCGIPAPKQGEKAPTNGERLLVTREELAVIVEDALRHRKRRW